MPEHLFHDRGPSRIQDIILPPSEKKAHIFNLEQEVTDEMWDRWKRVAGEHVTGAYRTPTLDVDKSFRPVPERIMGTGISMLSDMAFLFPERIDQLTKLVPPGNFDRVYNYFESVLPESNDASDDPTSFVRLLANYLRLYQSHYITDFSDEQWRIIRARYLQAAFAFSAFEAEAFIDMKALFPERYSILMAEEPRLRQGMLSILKDMVKNVDLMSSYRERVKAAAAIRLLFSDGSGTQGKGLITDELWQKLVSDYRSEKDSAEGWTQSTIIGTTVDFAIVAAEEVTFGPYGIVLSRSQDHGQPIPLPEQRKY